MVMSVSIKGFSRKTHICDAFLAFQQFTIIELMSSVLDVLAVEKPDDTIMLKML